MGHAYLIKVGEYQGDFCNPPIPPFSKGGDKGGFMNGVYLITEIPGRSLNLFYYILVSLLQNNLLKDIKPQRQKEHKEEKEKGGKGRNGDK
jgi:hypothetical protein